MKTRYKIITVIGIFVLFYVTVPLFTQHCNQISENCQVFWHLMHQTRAGMVVSSEDSAIEGWSTAQGGYIPSIADQLDANTPFIQTMIIPPIVIISGIILWDRRK